VYIINIGDANTGLDCITLRQYIPKSLTTMIKA